MEEKTLTIPKKIEISDSPAMYVGRKIMKVKMVDITSTHEFDVKVDGRNVIVKHPNKKDLTKFCTRLNKLIKDGGNKLGKIMG